VPSEISREQYALVHGPTTGDRVRLGDTSLVVEIEDDYAVYGDEVVSGWAKNVRNWMMIHGRRVGESELETSSWARSSSTRYSGSSRVPSGSRGTESSRSATPTSPTTSTR